MNSPLEFLQRGRLLLPCRILMFEPNPFFLLNFLMVLCRADLSSPKSLALLFHIFINNSVSIQVSLLVLHLFYFLPHLEEEDEDMIVSSFLYILNLFLQCSYKIDNLAGKPKIKGRQRVFLPICQS